MIVFGCFTDYRSSTGIVFERSQFDVIYIYGLVFWGVLVFVIT